MTENHTDPQTPTGDPHEHKPRPPKSLHANVETWTDACSCEPEPRWQAIAEELESQPRGTAATGPTSAGGQKP